MEEEKEEVFWIDGHNNIANVYYTLCYLFCINILLFLFLQLTFINRIPRLD